MEIIEIEVRNETDKPLYVQLCRSLGSGRVFLHIRETPDEHTKTKITQGDYAVIKASGVLL